MAQVLEGQTHQFDSEGGDLLLTAGVVGLGSALVGSGRVWWVGQVSGWFEHP